MIGGEINRGLAAGEPVTAEYQVRSTEPQQHHQHREGHQLQYSIEVYVGGLDGYVQGAQAEPDIAAINELGAETEPQVPKRPSAAGGRTIEKADAG